MAKDGPARRQTLELSPAEVRAVHLWRRIGYGRVELHIRNGEPVEAQGNVSIRLDKPEHPGAVELIAAAAR